MTCQRGIVLLYFLIWSSVVFFAAIRQVRGNGNDTYYHIGCYKEGNRNRTLPVLLANNSQSRLSNIGKVRRCAQLTYRKGYKAFGVQNNGECWSGTQAMSTYDIHGDDTSCTNGTGGVKANDVYFLAHKFEHAGCFKEDPNNRAMPMSVAMNSGRRSTILRRCARASWRMGFTKAFGLVNGGQCWSGINASLTYNKHGRSNQCRRSLIGGPLAIDVYLFKTIAPTTKLLPVTASPTTVEKSNVKKEVDYYHIGCFKDTSNRTMPERLGTWRHLGKASIMKCAKATRSKGYKVFGVQYSGECWSGVNASLTYDKYGNATNCRNGTGGDWANDVYFFYTSTSTTNPTTHITTYTSTSATKKASTSRSPQTRTTKPSSKITCKKENTGKPKMKGIFTWEVSEIGETKTVACPSGPDGSNATRTCGGNVDTGAEWNTPDDESCEYKSQKTNEMNKLSKMKINSDNAKEVANNFTKMFKSGSVKNMSEADASIAADMVAKIVEMDAQLNETADMVVEIIDTMMEMNASVMPANASTKIVQALNTVAEKIPLEEGATSRVLNSTNLAIQANEVTRSTFKGIGFGIKQNTNDGRRVVTSEDQTNLFIKLPKSTLNRSRNASARIGFIYFANHNLFQVKPSEEEKDKESAIKREPSQEVLSSSVYGTDTSSLLDNVTLTFPRPRGKDLEKSSCVFWNVKGRQWSDEGCSLCDKSNNGGDSVACCCNHLTSFAVLFSPETEPLSGEDKKHERILGVISYIGCGISLVGVVLTFLTYSLFRHLRKTNQQPILMNLCVALVLLLLVFAVGVDSTSNRIGCQIVAGLLHYLTLVTVLWMGIEAYNLYLQLVKVMAIYHRKFMLKASIVAWGVPGIIVIATVVAAVIEYNRNEDGNRVFYYGNDKVCILHNHLYRMISWFAPILAILLFNMVMFVLVIYKLNCTGAMVPVDTKSSQKKRCWTAVAIMTLLGVTWLFGALAISGARLVFEYLFCIFNSLQGFFIFFFHCVRIKEVRNQWSFFMSGLGFSHKESGSSQPRSRGIGESHHSSEAPYVKVKKWTNKESEAEQPERKITMVTLVEDKDGHENDEHQVDIELNEVKDPDNVAVC